MDIGRLLELRQAYPLSFSRDGGTLLVASDLSGTRQLHCVAATGGELTQLTALPEPVDGQLLPDGRILLLMDEGGNERTQLYVLEGRSDTEPRPLVLDRRFIHTTPRASRDGALLAYATNRRNGRDFDIVARSLVNGEERSFELGGWCSVESISPDGHWIAAGRLGERSGDGDLYLLGIESGEIVHVTPHVGEAEYGAPAWLPDSSGFFAATSAGRDTRGIGRFDLAGRVWEVVHEGPWDLDCLLDDGGRTLLVIANEDGYSRLELRSPGSLALRAEVPLPGRGVVEHPLFSPDGSLLAFAFSSPSRPFEVHVHELSTGRTRRTTEVVRGIGPARLAEPALHRFASFDGVEVPVFLFEPDGKGPFPVVVTVHGGPEAQWRPWYSQGFGPLTQHLVARGYAVAAPNVRGSTGYGRRYEHLDDGELRLDAVRDLAALHDWLARRPEVDASRAVVYGRSYGGYMTLAALAFQPERWAAGIEMVGIASLVSFLENTSDYRRAAREREYGSLERDREFLERASPLNHADAIGAPLFIAHGRNDPRVPVTESERIHRVLTGRGVRCELVVYEDEGHTLEKLDNRVDAFTRAVAFLDEVLPPTR